LQQSAKYESDVKLWISVADLHHKMFWLRQKELSQYDITVSQLYILVVIENLGAKATISTVAKALGRHVDVLSRQTTVLENNGLIKRTKERMGSRLLTITLTEKSLELLKVARHSKVMSEVLSVLTMEERQQFEPVLDKLLSNLNKYTFNQIHKWVP
jgi:DNA-binding MarR family transcriptional regulator